MATATITFIQYYTYKVNIDEKEYKDNPWRAEDLAIDEAYASFYEDMCKPFARTTYDDVEVEVECI